MMTTSELKNRLDKTVEYLRTELTQIRTGRANPSLLENIYVNAYESKMTLKELGSITLSDAQTIMVSPWDKSLLPEIAKAIRESEVNLNPVEVGATLKVPIPALTEERRKELAKLVNSKVEEAKQAMRNIRQEAMKDIDKEFEEDKLTEDDKFLLREEVEETVKEHVDEVEEMGEKKTKEIMTV
jgi:ribosome recycling factor